jgi:hypothetical protein
MEFFTIRHTFDRRYGSSFCFGTQHQTSTDELAIQRYAAGTAITGTATFFHTSKSKIVTQHIE